MTIGELKERYAEKFSVDVKHLMSIMKTQSDKVTLLSDSLKLCDIDSSKYYTMIYQVVPPVSEAEVGLEMHFY